MTPLSREQALDERTDMLEHRLEVERIHHEETKGYRQHAEIQLAEAQAEVIALRERVRELEHEVAAWRALASLQDGRYDVCFPGRRTMGDFGGSVTDRTKLIADDFGYYRPEMTYGEGPTPEAAAIQLAGRLGIVERKGP